jgi:hypothetical protein
MFTANSFICLLFFVFSLLQMIGELFSLTRVDTRNNQVENEPVASSNHS